MSRDVLKLLRGFHKKVSKYRDIKNSEQKKSSVHFAVSCIIESLFIVGLAFVAAMGLKMLMAGSFLGVLFGIFVLVLGGIGTLLLFINALMSCVYQLSLNRKVIGFIALVIFLISLGGAAFVIIIII